MSFIGRLVHSKQEFINAEVEESIKLVCYNITIVTLLISLWIGIRLLTTARELQSSDSEAAMVKK